ncbi:MAG: hypothetical protein WCP11_00765 [Candidatus Saccharibacteria bacterium]
MNETPAKIKQQIVDKIKASSNILIAVSRDPSVDDLSAALGLTTLLNKLGKHSTAIFSGDIPPAINFLEPDKVFENTIDSLRDFIIALDKEKADHLRYKVDGDVVKIFITPYRTVISSEDLEFSQGDYNVELVLVLGVENPDHLDMALAAHGQILHDVTVASLSAGTQNSRLGSIEWHEDSASCLCEMVTSLSEVLKTDAPILDQQIATALLTGIVSATERFSNPKTSAAVMTMAAQLMAAGADQQLIAAKLQESHELSNGVSSSAEIPSAGVATPPPHDDQLPGHLTIVHEEGQSVLPEVALPQTINPVLPQPQKSVDIPATPPILAGSMSPQSQASDIINAAIALQQEAAISQQSQIDNSVIVAPPISTSTLPDKNSKLIDILGNGQDMASTLSPDIPGVIKSDSLPVDGTTLDLHELNDASVTTNTLLPEPIIENHSMMMESNPVIDLPMPPPVPDFSSLVTSAQPAESSYNAMVNLETPPASTPNDPAQFKIPGQ